MTNRSKERREQRCYICKSLSKCLANAIDNVAVRCIDFGVLKEQADDAIEKLNSIGLPYPLSEEEIKSAIFFSNTTSPLE